MSNAKVMGMKVSKLGVLAGAATLAACSAAGSAGLPGLGSWPDNLEPATQVTVVTEGLSAPESVKYDPEQDVYFITNFNTGGGNARDNNGFISKVSPEGVVLQLKWVEGGANGVVLHAPKGMAITGETLWVADLDALRGFDRRTGAPVANIDLTSLGALVPNDVDEGPDGALYVTDTGQHRVYRIAGMAASTVLQDTVLNRPNGITWDESGSRFLIVPIGGKQQILSWRPGSTNIEVAATGPRGAFDGIEMIGPDRYLVTAQNDSSVQVFTGTTGRRLFATAGRPADLGLDTRRNRVALPFLALNRVEIWQLAR